MYVLLLNMVKRKYVIFRCVAFSNPKYYLLEYVILPSWVKFEQ